MDNSLKIGVVSGLIAGLVYGIIFTILAQITASSDAYYPFWQNPLSSIVGITILQAIIWGAILGLIYAKIYCVIPGKDILRGIIFALVIYLIKTVKMQYFTYAYGTSLPMTVGLLFIEFFSWIAFGLVIGILYLSLVRRYYPSGEKAEVKEYSMKGGLIPGAFAGLLGGFAASVVAAVGPALRFWTIIGVDVRPTFDIWFTQVGTHMYINMIFGAIVGAIYLKVYNLVPSTGVKKGLIYSMVIWVISAFQIWTYLISWFAILNNWQLVIYFSIGVPAIGIAHYIIYGIVLGYLCKK